MARLHGSETVCARRFVALECELHQPVDQLHVGDPTGPEQRPVDAGLRETGHRVDLVEHQGVADAEEVNSRKTAAAGVDEGFDRELADAVADRGRDPRGDHEPHPTRRVLGLIVVPALFTGAEQDLAGLGSGRLVVAEHRAPDLAALSGGLDDRDRVVGERGRQRAVELFDLDDPGDPDRRAEPSGLDEHGQAKRGDPVAHARRRGPVLDRRDRFVWDLRDSGLRHQLLEHDLVHALGGRKHAGADVGHVEALEQALDRPVLAERPVQDREHHVVAGKPRAGSERQRLAITAPDSVAPDVDHRRLVAGRSQALADRGRRGERHLVLGGPASGEHRDPARGHGDLAVVDEVVAGLLVVVDVDVEVVGDVVLVVVVVMFVGTNLPTTIVTELPCLDLAPPRGVWLITSPFWVWSVTFWVSRVTVKPAPVNVLFAFAAERPPTPGTWTEGGALATTIETVDPETASVFAGGLWLITLPGVAVVEVSVVGPTWKPAAVSSALAVA